MVLATGGYGNVFYLSTNAKGCNVTATWRAYRRGALFANPCYTQIHPTCIPVTGDYQSKLTLMSESLRNDGRVWVPKEPGDKRPPDQIPEAERDYYLERKYPSFGNLVPRDVAARAAKKVCDEGRGVGPRAGRRLPRLRRRHRAAGRRQLIEERYGNLFEMYERITGENPYEVPMRIYPAPHYTMGGLWVDYNLMSNVPGLFVARRGQLLRPRRQPPRRQRAHAGAGRRLLRHPLHDRRLPREPTGRGADRPTPTPSATPRPTSSERLKRLLAIKGKRSRRLVPPRARQASCGTTAAWPATAEGLKKALRADPGAARGVLEQRARASAAASELNQALEKAGRVADFLELAELMCRDALERDESCGGHFREEYQTPDGEALRDDEHFSYVAAWEYKGEGQAPALHKEPLDFEYVQAQPKELQVMNLTLHVWRQKSPADAGAHGRNTRSTDVSPNMSFLEMLDVVNEELAAQGEEPIAFDHDCREGICGTCGFMINGVAHGPSRGTTVCQLHMRHFKDGDVLHVEPWRARPSRSSRTWWSTAAPSTASSRPAASSRCRPAARRTPT